MKKRSSVDRSKSVLHLERHTRATRSEQSSRQNTKQNSTNASFDAQDAHAESRESRRERAALALRISGGAEWRLALVRNARLHARMISHTRSLARS